MKKFSYTSPLIDTLKHRSEERVSKDPEFGYINADMKRFRERLDLNQLSLNQTVRKGELALDKSRKEERKAMRKLNPVPEPIAYEVTLDTLDQKILPKVTVKKKPAKEKLAKDPDAEEEEADAAGTPDPVRHEAVNILQDLTTEFNSLRTAKTTPST